MSTAKVIVGYFAAWSIYRKGHFLWDLDCAKITHLNYAFAKIENGVVALSDLWADKDQRFLEHGDSWSDDEQFLFGNLNQLYKLKMKNRNMKTGLSVGGWTFSDQFSLACQTKESRRKFADSLVKMILNLGMDYIDIDWEFPVEGGLDTNTKSPQDDQNLLELLKELNKSFCEIYNNTKKRHFVTLAVPATPNVASHLLKWDLWKFVEFVNLMTYDFSGNWSKTCQHQANLYPCKSSCNSVYETVELYLQRGFPADKLVVGIPLYGRMFKSSHLISDLSLIMGSTLAPLCMPDENILGYNEIDSSSSTYWDDEAKAAVVYNPASQIIVSFENLQSLSHKLDFIKTSNLRGIMFWESSTDYPSNHPKSILNSIWNSFQNELEMSENIIEYPNSIYPNISKQK